MDLAVVAALWVKEDLARKAGVEVPLLTASDGVPTAPFPAPKQVASKSTVVHKQHWIVASGGISINPWKAVQQSRTTADLAATRAKTAAKAPTKWWWD
jgi:hypothetical protein